MLLPATAVYASSDHAERGVSTRAETRRDHRITSRPSVQLDHVYRGALDGAVGTHTWSGDVFDTGVVTTVTYDIALDADGTPVVSSVVVDDATLPEGATYTIRDGSTTTRDDGKSEDEKTEKSEDWSGESSQDSDETTDENGGAETLVNASVTAATSDETAGEDDEETSVDDGTESDEAVDGATDDEEAVDDDVAEETETVVTRFAARAGVRFSMGDQWAGLLILVHGALGDEPVASVRTILVTPSQPVEDVTTDETAAEEDEVDRHEKPGRPQIDDVRNDRDPVDRDSSKQRDDDRQRERGDRTDRDRSDRSRDGDRRGSEGGSRSDNGRSEGRP